MPKLMELAAGLRQIAAELDEPDTNDGHDIPGGYVPHPWSRLIYDAADYIERTAPPADNPTLNDAVHQALVAFCGHGVTRVQVSEAQAIIERGLRTAPPDDALVRYDMQVDDGRVRAPMREDGGWVRYEDAAAAIASARAVPPADGLPEFETTAEERAKVLAAEKSISLRPGDIPGTVIRIIRDLETAEAERDREAAARREAVERIETARDEGATSAIDILARALGLASWTIHDGTETWDGDVAATIYGILHDAKVLDLETDELATARAEQAKAREATLRAALEPFAKRADEVERFPSMKAARDVGITVSIAMCRAARAALATTSTANVK